MTMFLQSEKATVSALAVIMLSFLIENSLDGKTAGLVGLDIYP
jgi:hypothetical protein